MKAVFIIIILGLLGTGTYFFITKKMFRASAETATGKVIGFASSRNTKGRTNYAPVVSFIAKDNKEYSFRRSFYSRPAGYAIGEQVTVFYDPKNPKEAEIDSATSYLVSYILWGIGLFFLLIWRIVVAARRRKQSAGATTNTTMNPPNL